MIGAGNRFIWEKIGKLGKVCAGMLARYRVALQR